MQPYIQSLFTTTLTLLILASLPAAVIWKANQDPAQMSIPQQQAHYYDYSHYQVSHSDLARVLSGF